MKVTRVAKSNCQASTVTWNKPVQKTRFSPGLQASDTWKSCHLQRK